MEKLELKHLAGYLPYELKGISIEENLGIETVKGFSIYGINKTVCLSTNIDDIDLELFNPILRPLSDLTKEIEVNGEKFVPSDLLNINQNFLNKDFVLACPFFVVQKLLEWYFDIYGLIEKNLAIDINTLEP